MNQTIRAYGKAPRRIALLHGGPGAAGEMKPLAEKLAPRFGVLELLQTEKTIEGQIEELRCQLLEAADAPVILTGFSWGAWLGLLFAARFPALTGKLILIGCGALEDKYNNNLMSSRLKRLPKREREEAELILSQINSGSPGRDMFRRFGELMNRADSYDPDDSEETSLELDMEIHQSVWQEASALRSAGGLIKAAEKITCPVTVIHGLYDPHPLEGVEKPLSGLIREFRMVRLEKSGHTPWKEKHAKDVFYQKLIDELMGIS